MITDAASLSDDESKRFAKKSGIVAESRCCVRSRVRRPRIIHARSEPTTALPMPTHVEEMPYFQPNCPA